MKNMAGSRSPYISALAALAAALCLCLFGGSAGAHGFPVRPLRMIVHG